MSKKISNNLQKIKIWELIRQIRQINGYNYINLFGSDKSKAFVQLSHTRTDTNNKTSHFDYEIQLTQTPCYFGGTRCWFICPLDKGNNDHCGRRVGVLYKAEDKFGCRHCYNLTYASRNLGGAEKKYRHRLDHLELEKIRGGVKRINYKGKLTKKYLRYLSKKTLADQSYLGIINHINNWVDRKTSKKVTRKKHKKGI
jgi:hypothetical protein